MKALEKTIGIRLKIITYIGKDKFEKEKTIFSIRELYKLLSKVISNRVVYGLGIEDNALVLHLFVDRVMLRHPDEVDNKIKLKE